MQLLDGASVRALRKKTLPDALFLEPLLDDTQIGEVTIDLRLGYDFQVSVLTRKAHIGLQREDPDFRGIKSYFQLTRREIGDRFVLYPNQIALATTLEYLGLPSFLYADVLTRSSYARLGMHHNTMIQPGFKGCVPLELVNHSNNAIELIVGSRIAQLRLFVLDNPAEYATGSAPRKYYGNVRPEPSRAASDLDLGILEKIRVSRT